MDISKYISMAYDYASWFSGTVAGTVSGSVAGGWMAVAAFTGVIVVMFLITSLISPRRD
jgi:Fe2+ transport system protein B